MGLPGNLGNTIHTDSSLVAEECIDELDPRRDAVTLSEI
jgi:hypothetical protein